MKKLPKKPKARKLPKKPKASASINSWRSYEARVKATHSHNKQAEDTWKRKVAKIKSDEHERQALIRKYSR